jgi:sugar phosphate isomerase/epimerase
MGQSHRDTVAGHREGGGGEGHAAEVDARRRSFLRMFGGMLGGMVMVPGMSRLRALGIVMGEPGPGSSDGRARRLERIGIQLYTVRHLMERDAAGTLAKLAEVGYREVEFAGLYGTSARKMREILDRNHLSAPSGHIGTAEMRGDWARTLADATTLGQSYITCAWIDQAERTVDGYKQIADLFNRSGETARAAGLQFCYHNHDFEFGKVDGVVPYDLLLSACDPELVKMEMDIFWLVRAGRSPTVYFEANPGRFALVHVKDMDCAGEMVDVGNGIIDFHAIFRQSSKAGIRHYFVEHDNPSDPLATARASYDYLRRLEY